MKTRREGYPEIQECKDLSKERDELVVHRSLASEHAHSHSRWPLQMTEFIKHPGETQLPSSHYLKVENKPP